MHRRMHTGTPPCSSGRRAQMFSTRGDFPLASCSLEMLDKVEPPSIPEGYAMSVAFSALLDLVRGITAMMERELAREEEEAGQHREINPDKQWKPPPGG